MKANKNITISDLAKALKTSTSTISRALKDHPKISQEMKSKVKDMAIKMGYIQKIQASIQQNLNTNLVGIILPSVRITKYRTIIESSRKILEKAGFTVIISLSSNSSKLEEEIIKLHKTLNIRGLITSLTHENKNPKYIHKLAETMPVVLIDRINFEIPCTKIMIDHYQAGFRAVQHLLKINCKNIAHIGGDIKCSLVKKISAGYKTALRQSNQTINSKLEVFSDNIVEDIMKATELIYSTKVKPDAILVDDIAAAQKLISILQAKKIKIPDDVAIIAIGDESDYTFYSPSITTIQLPYYEVAIKASNALIDALNSDMPITNNQTIVEPFSLNTRNSTLK